MYGHSLLLCNAKCLILLSIDTKLYYEISWSFAIFRNRQKQNNALIACATTAVEDKKL